MHSLHRWEGPPVNTCQTYATLTAARASGSKQFREPQYPSSPTGPQVVEVGRAEAAPARAGSSPDRGGPEALRPGRDYGFDIGYASYYFLRCWLWPFRFLASEKFYFLNLFHK
jgi:hypothetical protein